MPTNIMNRLGQLFEQHFQEVLQAPFQIRFRRITSSFSADYIATRPANNVFCSSRFDQNFGQSPKHDFSQKSHSEQGHHVGQDEASKSSFSPKDSSSRLLHAHDSVSSPLNWGIELSVPTLCFFLDLALGYPPEFRAEENESPKNTSPLPLRISSMETRLLLRLLPLLFEPVWTFLVAQSASALSFPPFVDKKRGKKEKAFFEFPIPSDLDAPEPHSPPAFSKANAQKENSRSDFPDVFSIDFPDKDSPNASKNRPQNSPTASSSPIPLPSGKNLTETSVAGREGGAQCLSNAQKDAQTDKSTAESDSSAPIPNTNVSDSGIPNTIEPGSRDSRLDWRSILADPAPFELHQQSLPLWFFSETLFAVEFDLFLFERQAKMSLIFPLPFWKLLGYEGKSLSQRSQKQEPCPSECSASVEVSVEIGSLPLSAEQFQRLKPGDLLRTEIPVDSLFTVNIENEPCFKGHPGLYQGVPSVQIEEVLESPNSPKPQS